MKILIAVDGSTYTRTALEYVAAQQWLRSGNELTVFTAVLPLPHRAAAFAGPDLTRNYYEDDAEAALRPARQFMSEHGIPAEFKYSIGHVAEAIVREAKLGPSEMIVMGSHGHGAMANVVLGSVATRVVASCGIPVLLVR